MIEDKKTYNGHTYNGVLLSACVDGYEQGRTDADKFLKQWKDDVVESFAKYDAESVEEVYLKGKADAIEEFVKFANTMPTVEKDDGEIRPMWLEEMAEKLKEQNNG